jgi:hypothetical protein
MKNLMWTSCVLVALLVAPTPASGQSPEERIAAREVVRKRADAVVTVLATIKLHVTVNGTEQQATEQPAQANATILDASGLAVTSLSMLKPDEGLERRIVSQTRPGTKAEVRSEVIDLRMRLADGREVPVRQVLNDTDLDLAFLRPIEPVTSPMTAVDAPTFKPAVLDLLVALQRAQESAGWQSAAAFTFVQLVIDKPRTYYLMSAAPSPGSPVFDPSGRFVGITVLRSTGARGAGSFAVLPADDVRDVAKQATEK